MLPKKQEEQIGADQQSIFDEHNNQEAELQSNDYDVSLYDEHEVDHAVQIKIHRELSDLDRKITFTWSIVVIGQVARDVSKPFRLFEKLTLWTVHMLYLTFYPMLLYPKLYLTSYHSL